MEKEDLKVNPCGCGSLKTTGGYMFKLETEKNKIIDLKDWEQVKKDKGIKEHCKGQPSPQRIDHQIVNNVKGKKCCTCKVWRPLIEYNSSELHWDGFRNDCMLCLEKYRKKNRKKIQISTNKCHKKRLTTDEN